MSPLNDAAVEAAARANADSRDGSIQFDSPGFKDEWRDYFRAKARITLTAALPHLRNDWEAEVRATLGGIQSSFGEEIHGAMRDGSEIAVRLAVDMAKDLATKVSPEQSAALLGFAAALKESANELYVRVTPEVTE